MTALSSAAVLHARIKHIMSLNLIPIVVRYTSGIWAFLQSPILSPLESNQSEIPSAVQLGCHSFFQTLCPRISVSLSVCLSSNRSNWNVRSVRNAASSLSPSQQVQFLWSRAWNDQSAQNAACSSLSPNRPDFCVQEFGTFWCVRNAASSLSLPMVPILEIKSLKCLIYPKCRFFTPSSNRSGSCDQELGMLDLSEMQFHCLPTDPILAIKSLECSDLSEIQPTWRSRAWNVLISPKRSFFTLSSNRSNSCDHELGMCDLSEMQLQ